MDNHNVETRSYNMAQIKSKNTGPEMIVRKYLFSKGFRYRIHNDTLPGKPDLVFKKYNTVIFINGCFWHRHKGCRYATIPKTRTDYWINKLNKNVERDQTNNNLLKDMGWNVIIIWECQLKKEHLEKTMHRVISSILDIGTLCEKTVLI